MEQVADWLEKLGLGQYTQRFAENDISFAVLPDLTVAMRARTAFAEIQAMCINALIMPKPRKPNP
jgi:hypothetical protein